MAMDPPMDLLQRQCSLTQIREAHRCCERSHSAATRSQRFQYRSDLSSESQAFVPTQSEASQRARSAARTAHPLQREVLNKVVLNSALTLPNSYYENANIRFNANIGANKIIAVKSAARIPHSETLFGLRLVLPARVRCREMILPISWPATIRILITCQADLIEGSFTLTRKRRIPTPPKGNRITSEATSHQGSLSFTSSIIVQAKINT